MANAEEKKAAPAKTQAKRSEGSSPPKKAKGKDARVVAKKPAPVKNVPKHNYKLPTGVWRYSRSEMVHRRAKYRYINKSPAERRKTQMRRQKKKKPARFITKKIGGEKNGGVRRIRVRKLPRYYPTETKPRKPSTKKKFFCQHKRKLRKSITPGTILIIVAGRHRGKRVVFLKQLKSGLLLITGPYEVNKVPMRRMNQIYVIATKTKLNITDVKIPKGVSDGYFRRKNKNKKYKKKDAGEIFESKKEKRMVSERRKNDQIDIDKQILNVISAHKQKKTLLRYLVRSFSLSNKMYPHRMVF